MATWIQGVQDQLDAIRPPDENLQFNAQILSTAQSKYDQSHAKLSKMYGTILNASLSREDNQLAREEFFRLIQTDLHKIAGMDLSKQRNVAMGQNVFKQIYTNKPLVKDIVWTKHYNEQLERAEGFKNCLDQEDCGGQYWDGGIKYMQYKREEFRNATREQSMSFGNVDYVPFNNMMEDAIKAFKEVEHEIKIDRVGGKYKMTQKNGKLSVGPLTQLFSKLFANNPRYVEQFKVMAYNDRKDWIYNSVAKGDYKSLEEAHVGYIEKFRDQYEESFNATSKEIDHDHQKLKEAAEAFQDDLENNRITDPNSDEYKEGQKILELYGQSQQLQTFNEQLKRAQKGMYNQTTVSNISEYLDQLSSVELIKDEIVSVADTMSKQQQLVEYTEDKFALNDQKFKHDLIIEEKKHGYRMKEIAAKNDAKKSKFITQSMTEQNNYKLEGDKIADYENNYYVKLLEKARLSADDIAKITGGDGFDSKMSMEDFTKLVEDKHSKRISVTQLEEAQQGLAKDIQDAKIRQNNASYKHMYYQDKAGLEPTLLSINTDVIDPVIDEGQIANAVYYYRKDEDNKHYLDLLMQLRKDPELKVVVDKYMEMTVENIPLVTDVPVGDSSDDEDVLDEDKGGDDGTPEWE